MTLVLDASATLAWLFEDECTPAIETVFERVQDTGAFVPSLWRLEVANGLQMAMRRGRINASQRDASLRDLEQLAIAIDPETSAFAWSSIVQLSQSHALTIYDAAYLDLALRRGALLATLDARLREAGAACGLALLGL